jgi:uncharacterized membrane protein
VLASLLPGLRELRAPLSAGYLWLLAAWLLVESHVAGRKGATGVLGSLYELGTAAGAVGVAAAVSFIAYLVGSISEELWEEPWRRAMLAWRRPRSDAPEAWKTPSLSNDGLRSIQLLVSTASDRIHDVGLKPEDVRWQHAMPTTVTEGEPTGDMDFWLGRRTIDELGLVGARLMIDAPELFNAADRMRAESELRLAVIPPLGVLTAILAVEMSPLWLVLVLPLVALFRQAVRRRQQAGDGIADALWTGKVKAPVLERLESLIDEELARRGAQAAGVAG